MNWVPRPITFHPHFENFSPSLPLTFISQIEGLEADSGFWFLELFSLVQTGFNVQNPMSHVSSNDEHQNPLTVKRRPFEKRHPGRERRIREQRSSKASGGG